MDKGIIPDHGEISVENELTELCPFFSHPFPNCRCVNITSIDIPFVLEYCYGNYQECRIYSHNKLSEN